MAARWKCFRRRNLGHLRCQSTHTNVGPHIQTDSCPLLPGHLGRGLRMRGKACWKRDYILGTRLVSPPGPLSLKRGEGRTVSRIASQYEVESKIFTVPLCRPPDALTWLRRAMSSRSGDWHPTLDQYLRESTRGTTSSLSNSDH